MFLFLVLGSEPTFVTVASANRRAFERKNPQTALALSECALTANDVEHIKKRFMTLYAAVLARGSTLSDREAMLTAAGLFLRSAPESPGRMAA